MRSFPPNSVTMPTTFSLSIWAVSEGIKSSATIIDFSFIDLKSVPSTPNNILNNLLDTSFKSKALSFKYSSSILPNTDI